MNKAPYHQSPDGLMRPCSNPPECKFGTKADEHQVMTAKEADKANEKITESQMQAEGTSTIPRSSREQLVEERAQRHAGKSPTPVESVDIESAEASDREPDQEISDLDNRLAGYGEDNVAAAVVSGKKAIDAIQRKEGMVHSASLKKVLKESLDRIDPHSDDLGSSNAETAKEYSVRFDKTIAGNGDKESRNKAAKLVLIHAAKGLYSKKSELESRRDEKLREQDSDHRFDLHSDKERRLETARSQLHDSLVSSGLHDYRAGAKEREQQPFNTQYEDGGKSFDAKEVTLPKAMRQTLESRKFPVQKIYELDSTAEAAELYRQKAIEFKKDNPFHASLTVYDAEEYQGQRIFMSEDGHSGFVLKDTGDGERNEVVTVFSTKSAPKGAAYQMMAQSVGEGGSKLDCYNTVLPSIYSSVGFKEHDYWDWDDQYKPDDWDYGTYSSYNEGRPGVVLMEWTPDYEPARSVHDTRSTEDRLANR